MSSLTPNPPQDPLSGLERQLALQLQITEAARRLCAEENLSRQTRRQRKHAALQEEKKLRELQRSLGERRRSSEPPPAPSAHALGRGEAAPSALTARSSGRVVGSWAAWRRATAFAFSPRRQRPWHCV